MKDRLELLAQWLKNVTPSDFGYDDYRDGKLESSIAESQVEVCDRIGNYIEEILSYNYEQIKDELND